jgi:hypothetical protein
MDSAGNDSQTSPSSRRDGITGLLSRFGPRPRSSTTSSVQPDLATSPSRRPDNARERLQSILDSSKQHQQAHKQSGKAAKAPRSVSSPATASQDLSDAAGPYAANEPSVYLELLRPNKDMAPAAKCQYIRCLADAVRIYSDVDPLATWLQAAHVIGRNEHISVRLSGLDLMKTCVAAYDPAPLSITDKQTFYAFVQDYDVELEKRTDDEIRGLNRVCVALSRGGRDIIGLEDLIETLCDYAGEMYKRRQAQRDTIREDFFKQHPSLSLATASSPVILRRLSPLQDPSFIATFVSYPPAPELVLDDAAIGPIALLTNIHKFSWPHLSQADVAFATSYLVLEALATFNDTVVGLIIDHVDVMSRFGYVPANHIDVVIFFLARVVSLDGRGRTIVFVDEKGQDIEPRLEPFSSKLCDRARLVVKNLLRSSANQALRCLRGGLTPPGPEDELKDVQVAVGCIRCLRDVLNEIRTSPSIQAAEMLSVQSTFFDSWPILLAMGLPVLFPNLCDALLWPHFEVAEQVLLLLFDRLTRSTAEVPQTIGPSLSKTAELDLVEGPGQLTYDEWDLVLDLLERALPHVRRYEDETEAVWVLDLTPALSNGAHSFPFSASPSEAVNQRRARAMRKIGLARPSWQFTGASLSSR